MSEKKASDQTSAKEKQQPKIVYIEPADYFPKEVRRKYKLGEFAEPQGEAPAEVNNPK